MSSESILPQISQPAGRATRASLHLLLHPPSVLEFGFVEGEVPGHEVTHDSSRALESQEEAESRNSCFSGTPPALTQGFVELTLRGSEQVDAVPWLWSSPRDRATGSRLSNLFY